MAESIFMDVKPVYLDYNATTPLAPEVRSAIVDSLDNWGNPSSAHYLGVQAKKAIEKARGQVASMIGAKSSEITFTSGGTESNHLAIWTAIHHFRERSKKTPQIITTNIEHSAILEPLRKLENEGVCQVDYVPVVKGTGRVSVAELVSTVTDCTCLVTVMMANNETGIIQPVKQIFREITALNMTRNIPILVHTDAAQTIGKLDVNVDDLQADLLTIVGHKFYGPRIGALYHRGSDKWKVSPLLLGGGQEYGLRAGTENTPMIVGIGQAAELVNTNLDVYTNHMRKMRDYLRDGLIRKFNLVLEDTGTLDLGQVLWRYVDINMLPNTLSVRFGGTTGSSILHQLNHILIASTEWL
ncbi:selenocysteine lyase isoform X2 [Eurytemora carolleeae]|uniref:selenocysteine lyase isoform X2 n=1 Tax=Eurytemora carolleeae TaxID=1294199 RepID=UPI000C78FD25|nr:selenocysteine lyase isoform X2 [Eurytemora carolleeae]|eukprot:XP_023335092.1 selenocysteine lyase-like isoform X2 [Eurytemora affinis]